MANSGGGVLLPNEATTVTNWTLTTPTITTPTISGATLTTTTLTSPTLTSPTITGTTSIGTGATITTPAIVSPTITGTPVINTLKSNFSTATVSGGYSSDTYLAGSAIGVPTGGFTAGMKYTCIFDMVKTGAGTAQFTVTLRIGTGGGVVGDTSIQAFALGAGTANADTGRFVLEAYFRTVGSGTSAVIVGSLFVNHFLAATGLTNTGASGWGAVTAVSSGFDSTIAATTMGISVNGGGSFSGTNTYVETFLQGF